MRYDRISERINWISLSHGAGLWVISEGLSVVPAIVRPCHGKKKITLPSEVDGSSKPIASGLFK